MKQVKKLKNLEKLSVFNANTVSQVTSLEEERLYENISRWINDGVLIQLKKGFYTTSNYYKSLKDKDIYLEYISNKLKYPSYLSLEYVLTKYQVLSESVFIYTSITKKTPKEYSNTLGVFSYKNISEKLFLGFNIINKEGFEIAEATKSKALFDYLYLKFYRREISQNSVDGLRLNLDEFSRKDIKEFVKYCSLTEIKKFKELPKLLFKKEND